VVSATTSDYLFISQLLKMEQDVTDNIKDVHLESIAHNDNGRRTELRRRTSSGGGGVGGGRTRRR